MLLNAKPSEVVGIVGTINPAAIAASTVTTGWISAKLFTAFMAIVQVGAMGASGTINAKLEQATTSGGAGAKDIVGKLITAFTQVSTDDNKQAIINLRPEEMDVRNEFTHFRLSMTVAVATSSAAAIVLGVVPARGPATAVDATTVDEVVG